MHCQKRKLQRVVTLHTPSLWNEAAYAAAIEEGVAVPEAPTGVCWLCRSVGRDVFDAEASLAILISSGFCAISLGGPAWLISSVGLVVCPGLVELSTSRWGSKRSCCVSKCVVLISLIEASGPLFCDLAGAAVE